MIDKITTLLKEENQKRIQEKVKKEPYPSSSKLHFVNFKYAIDGIIWAFKAQPNFILHTFLLLLLIPVFFILHINIFELVILLALRGVSFTAEMFNTSLEALSDEVAGGKYKDFIRISKDTAAGAVLMLSIFEAIIWGLILYPYITL